nr:mitochondrial NADH-dependent fumarate reductase [Trypanosoma brucei]
MCHTRVWASMRLHGCLLSPLTSVSMCHPFWLQFFVCSFHLFLDTVARVSFTGLKSLTHRNRLVGVAMFSGPAEVYYTKSIQNNHRQLRRNVGGAQPGRGIYYSLLAVLLVVTFIKTASATLERVRVGIDMIRSREMAMVESENPRVIVVGGGLAGLSAAIEAAGCGAQVVLMEKEAKLGGNSAKATSGINGWGTRAQAKASIVDGGKYFERDTYKSGIGGNTDPALVKTLSMKSADAIGWLTSLGVPLTVLSQLGGHSRKRTHRAPDKKDGTPLPIGFAIVKTLEDHVRGNLSGRITIMENCSVTSLLSETKERPDGTKQIRVTGVEFTQAGSGKTTILADAVILATGGFSNDKTADSLLREHAPHLVNFPTTNGPWATGDGVKLAQRLGAQLVDMDKVQLHPTGLINPKDPANPTKFLGPEALRGSGGVLLNKQGKRFVNELDLRSVVSKAIMEQGAEYPGSGGSMFAYCVLNAAAQKLFGVSSHEFYWKKMGLFVKADTMRDLAALIGCPVESVQQTLEEYERLSISQRSCPITRKSVYPCVLGTKGPYYVAFVTPSIHYTMGGCLISPSAEIQMKNTSSRAPLSHSNPILGLFGAGEVTGGVHGGNRLGGNSLLECVVFGRIAGASAANAKYHNETHLWNNRWAKMVVESVLDDTNGFQWLYFRLPSTLQRSGVGPLQAVVLREMEGEGRLDVRIPFTVPGDVGVVGIMVYSNDENSSMGWLTALLPGGMVEMKAGVQVDANYERILALPRKVIIATRDGVAPMVQMIRAALHEAKDEPALQIIYIAERVATIPQREKLEQLQRDHPNKFKFTFVVHDPPPLWTGGVNIMEEISKSVFPDASLGVFLFASATESASLQVQLLELGHNKSNIVTL